MHNDQPETLSAILAEMRASAHDSFASKLVAEYEETGRLDEVPAAQALKDDDAYLAHLADRIEAAEMREREQKRKLYSKIISRLEDKLAESVRENKLLRAENEKRKNDLLKANRKIERLAGNIVSELKSALVEILDRTNREKARNYDAALNCGILEIHDIANTAINETKGE